MTTYVSPLPCGLTKHSISQLAGKFAELSGYKAGDDFEPAVNRMGGKVVYQDFWDLESSASGSIQVEPDSSFTVYVANHTAQTRDRFTVAHEVGHFALHYLLRKTTEPNSDWGLKASRFGTGPTEFEANYFAASFLMPRLQFLEAYSRFGKDIVDTADFFGVSVSAASVRAKVLGCD